MYPIFQHSIVPLFPPGRRPYGPEANCERSELSSSYDPASDIFDIQHVDFATLEQVSKGTDDRIFIASALREFTLEKFNPFIAEDKAIYKITSHKRDQAFKNVVLEQYGFKREKGSFLSVFSVITIR